MGKNNQKDLEGNIATTKNRRAISPAPAVSGPVQAHGFRGRLLPAKMVLLPPWPQQRGPPTRLVRKPALAFLPSDLGQGTSTRKKPDPLCATTGELLPAQGRGREENSGWEDDAGRNSLSSIAAFLKSPSVDSVLQLKITQASNKDVTSDVTGTSTPKK